MCGVSRFFTVPLPVSPVCRGSVAGSDHLYIQWKVAGCGYGKKIPHQDNQGKLGPPNPAPGGLHCCQAKGTVIFFSVRIWQGSHQALMAFQQHHTINGWTWGNTVSCLGVRKRVDLTIRCRFCVFDSRHFDQPCSISKWRFVYNETYPEISLVYQASVLPR